MKIELNENKVYFNNGSVKKEIHPFWLRERVDGEEFFTNCLITLEPCKTHDPSKPLCPVHSQYDKLRTEICAFYKDTTLEIISKDIDKYQEFVKL